MFSLKTRRPLRLVQITDTHLNEPEDGHLLGMQTLHSLRCVLELVREERHQIDAFLVTGDLSQDGSLEAYHHLQRELTPFSCPSFWLAGNHDDPDNMAVPIHAPQPRCAAHGASGPALRHRLCHAAGAGHRQGGL